MSASVYLTPVPILQFFDNAGRPNVGGSILTQVGGVNYPTYEDYNGTTPLPNPIPLNSRGEVSNSSGVSCQLFVAEGVVYTFKLYDAAGNLLNEADYVSNNGIFSDGSLERVVNSIAELRTLSHLSYKAVFVTGYYARGDGGGGHYQYVASDTTSVDNGGTIIVASDGGRWYLQFERSISPKQFGAKGDGVNDDATQFNNMLNWVWTQTKSRPLFGNTPNMGMFCIDGSGYEYFFKGFWQPPTDGGGGVIFQDMMLTAIAPLSDNPISLVTSALHNFQNIIFRNVAWNGNNNNGLTGIDLIKLYNCHNVEFDSCFFVGFTNNNFGVYSDANSNDIRVHHCYFQQWIAGEHDNVHDKTGIACNFVGPDNYFCDNIVAAAGTGIVHNSNTTISRNHFYGIDNWAIDPQSNFTQYCTIDNNYFDQASIRVIGGYLSRVIDNRFIGINRGTGVQFEPQSNGWSMSNFIMSGNDFTGLGSQFSGIPAVGTITPSAVTGTITITGSAADFSTSTWNNPSGAIIAGNGGIALVVGVNNASSLTAVVLNDFASTSAIAQGSWTVTQSAWYQYNFGVHGAFAADGASFITEPNNNGGVYIVYGGSTGLFTPSLSGTGGSASNTYVLQRGIYKVVNGMCHFNLSVAISAADSGMTGNLLIRGLPFNSNALPLNIDPPVSFGIVDYVTMPSGTFQMTGYIPGGANYIQVNALKSGNPNVAVPASAIMGASGDTQVEICVSGSYRVA